MGTRLTLVVGATGQLGAAVAGCLVRGGHGTRALVRPGSRRDHLPADGVELVEGDLRDRDSLLRACRDADTVIATANAVVPRSRSDVRAIDAGYEALISAAEREGVRRFVYISVPVSAIDAEVGEARHKRRVEQLLETSRLEATIVRASLFMDEWLALIGSRLPYAGRPGATLDRPFWLSRTFMRLIGSSIDRRGLALVPGPGDHRHAFVASDDVAELLVHVAVDPDAGGRVFEFGGPQVLTWNDVVGIYAQLLDRRVRCVHLPAALYRMQSTLFRPFSPAAAELMSLQRFAASIETPFDSSELAARYGLELTTVEAFLRSRIANAARG